MQGKKLKQLLTPEKKSGKEDSNYSASFGSVINTELKKIFLSKYS